jgi:F-type H+-transporting ATPase subunit a
MRKRMTGQLIRLFTIACMCFAAPATMWAQEHGATTHAATTAAAAADAHAAPAHGDSAGHGDAAHAGEEHHGGGHGPASPELPTWIHVLNSVKTDDHKTFGDTAIGHFLHSYEKQIYLLMVTVALCLAIFYALRLTALKPGKAQAGMEFVVDGMYSFFTGILGTEHKRHVPFFASLFLFIFFNNLMGAVFLMGPATSKIQTTATLALIVFFYVHFFAIKEGGILHLLWHLCGSPRDLVGWIMAPLLFVLEFIGTLAKPLSLSLRLFGNIMGEDILLGVFLILGLGISSAIVPASPVGLPLHFPFLFLVLLTSTIQALVFSLLSAIYLAMVLPHHDHEHGHDVTHGEDQHELLPGAEEKNEKSGHVDAGVAAFAG